ncbi:MAG: UDP-N-acetylglucosamine 2-epimerase (non-hydrolyzing) [Candidatus Nanopelagicales bacterium]
MKVTSVVGARPEFIKIAPICVAFEKFGIEHEIIHTGQHYDSLMSDVFFADLKIPSPDVDLGVGSGSHGEQTGAMLAELDRWFSNNQTDWVLAYGDTNSTIAAALAAVKLHVPVAHVEAGLRSFNRLMPEEHNRIMTDHISDILLAPTERAMEHLAAEGLAERAVNVGDVQADICWRVRDALAGQDPWVPGGLNQGDSFYLATLHRAENTDDMNRLGEVLGALANSDKPVVITVHPRLLARTQEFGLDLEAGALVPIDPLPYPEMVAAVIASDGVITDSGGLQKEAYLLDRLCTTVRSETEWVETLDDGWNVIANQPDEIIAAASRSLPTTRNEYLYGAGDASEKIAEVLLSTEER